jgi:hypothetical protein
MVPGGPPGGMLPGLPMPKLPLRVRLQILWYAFRFKLGRAVPSGAGLWTVLPLVLSTALMLALGVAWRLLAGGR